MDFLSFLGLQPREDDPSQLDFEQGRAKAQKIRARLSQMLGVEICEEAFFSGPDFQHGWPPSFLSPPSFVRS